MDTILATAIAARIKNSKDGFDEYTTTTPTGVPVTARETPSVWGNATSNIVGLMVAVLAAYLSWTCNSGMKYPLYLQILFAFFAFNFGGMYLMYYALFRYDACRALK